jgi:hypothetical protein
LCQSVGRQPGGSGSFTAMEPICPAGISAFSSLSTRMS